MIDVLKGVMCSKRLDVKKDQMIWKFPAKWVMVAVGLLFLAAAATAGEDAVFPEASWKDKLDPLASEHALVGGEISVFGGQYPKA
ncbi:MAG: hypothetical protein R2860_06555 [Desulfobacterales bacterium]